MMDELCETVVEQPVLSKYELQGLRFLREWLPNQPTDSVPTELDDKDSLLNSMMVRSNWSCLLLYICVQWRQIFTDLGFTLKLTPDLKKIIDFMFRLNWEETRLLIGHIVTHTDQ